MALFWGAFLDSLITTETSAKAGLGGEIHALCAQ